MSNEDIGARHKPTEFPIHVTKYCTFCKQPWPCDAAELLAQLAEARAGLVNAEIAMRHNFGAARRVEAERDAAIERGVRACDFVRIFYELVLLRGKGWRRAEAENERLRGAIQMWDDYDDLPRHEYNVKYPWLDDRYSYDEREQLRYALTRAALAGEES